VTERPHGRERHTDWRLYTLGDFSEIKGQEHVERALEVKGAPYFAELKPENIMTIVYLLNPYLMNVI
jgi:hypothetical protein